MAGLIEIQPINDTEEDACTIPLTRGLVALVDATDFEYLSQFKWQAHCGKGKRTCYARRRDYSAAKHTLMHREILGTAPGVLVDHINGNGLDCRRQNLREATQTQSMWNRVRQRNNTSGYKGVREQKNLPGRWEARIGIAGKSPSLGFFDSPQDAARAYDAAARKLYGAFARLNFPEEMS